MSIWDSKLSKFYRNYSIKAWQDADDVIAVLSTTSTKDESTLPNVKRSRIEFDIDDVNNAAQFVASLVLQS